MTLLACTLLFWPFLIWVETKKPALVLWAFALVLGLAAMDWQVLQGAVTYTHDAVGYAAQSHNHFQIARDFPPTQWVHQMAGWDPYTGLGQAIDPPQYPEYYLLLLSNRYLGWALGPIQMINLMAWNFQVATAVGLLLTAFRIRSGFTMPAAAFAFALASDQLGTTFLANQGAFVVYFPFFTYFSLKYIQQRRSRDYFLAGICLSFTVSRYLPTTAGLSGLVFLLSWILTHQRPWDNLRSLLPIHRWWLIASTLLMMALIFGYDLQLARNSAGQTALNRGNIQGRTVALDTPATVSDKIRGHHVHYADLAALLGARLSTPHHGPRWAGLLAPYFALVALTIGIIYLKQDNLALVAAFSLALMLGFGRYGPFLEMVGLIPVLNMLRHYIFFFNFIFVFFVLLAALGFSQWMHLIQFGSKRVRLLLSLAALELLLLWLFISKGGPASTRGHLLGWSLIYLLLIVLPWLSRQPKPAMLFGCWALFVAAWGLQADQHRREALLVGNPFDQPSPKPWVEPTSRDCIAPPKKSDYHWPWRARTACVTHHTAVIAPQMSFFGYHVLKIAYPSFFNSALLTTNQSNRLVKPFRLLGTQFPLYFYVPEAQSLSEQCLSNETCFEKKLKNLIQHYQSGSPSYVLLMEPDIKSVSDQTTEQGFIPAAINQAESSRTLVSGTLNAPAPGYLVRLQNFDPRWSAQINGEQVRVFKANGPFQAIKVPKGKVQFKFHWSNALPKWVLAQVMVWLFAAGVWLFSGMGRPKAPVPH